MGKHAEDTHSFEKTTTTGIFLLKTPRRQSCCIPRKGTEYKGPYVVTSVKDKDVQIELGEPTGPRSFNIAQIKPWPLDKENPPLDRPDSAVVFNSPEPSEPATIHWMETIYPSDTRTALFEGAKRKELLGLIERGTFRLILKEDVGPYPNVIPSRFVLCIKHEAGQEHLKARFVLGGHRDRDKKSLIHNSTTLKHQSVRLILTFASIFGFDIWSSDVNQAYLQSAEKLQRDIFIRPVELELAPNELLQLMLPLYGITESGDYWGETLTDHHINDLNMTQTKQDFSFFFKHDAGKLVGLSGAFVDDLVRAGTLQFKTSSQETTEGRFDIKPPSADNFTFAGFDIKTHADYLEISQRDYIRRLKIVPVSCDFDAFRTVRAKLQWASHSRPDISFAASRLAQVTANSFSAGTITLSNKVIKHLKTHPELALRYPKLDKSTLRILAYSDASLHNNEDLSSQLGYVILLADASNQCCVLSFRSFKSKRIARSSMAAETMAFADAFDAAFALKSDLVSIFGRPIPLLILTDSKPLFDVIVSAKYTTEKRLMIDISAAREGFNRGDISNICLINSEDNIADPMTKLSPNPALQQLLSRHVIDHKILQYVIDPATLKENKQKEDSQNFTKSN
jgi:Reverse transcriptase (RNA-dependent DNA polymerase)